GDDVDVVAGVANFNNKNVANNKEVTFTGFDLSGTDMNNYTFAGQPASVTANITQQPITVTVTDQSNVVYGTAVTPAYTANVVLFSDDSFTGTLAIDGARSTSDNLVAGTHNIVQSTLAISDGNNGGNYNLLFVGKTFTVTPQTATIINLTADNKVYDENTLATILGTAVIEGKVEGDILNVVAGGANFDTKHVANGKKVTFTGFSLSGADVSNYAFAGQPASVLANITQAELTVTPDNGQSKVYGATDLPLTFQYSGFVGNDDATLFAGALTRDAGDNVGTYTIQQGNLSAGINYTINFTADKTFAITPATLTVTADDKTKIYGDSDPAWTFVATGFELGDNESVFAGELTREAGEIVGNYAILQGNLSAGINYTISFVPGTLTIDRLSQSITFDPEAILQVENGSYALVATASSGLEVQFRLRNGDETFANLSATTLTPLQSGQIEVTAFIENDHNYLDAAESRTITIISSNAAVGNVELSNVTETAPDFYLVDCGDIDEITITIAPEEIGAKVWHNGVEGKTFSINTSRADVYTVNYSIESSAGNTVNYSVTVEKQFSFGEIVGTKFNNILFVKNNPEINGGYRFATCEWFENGQSIGDGQYYSAGNKRSDLLNEASQYSVTITTEEGKILHTCEGTISLQGESLRVYPNPAKQSEPITIEYVTQKEASKKAGDATIQVYDALGMLVNIRQLVNGNLQQISLPTAGIYMIKIGNEIVKIIVK
ncbi:MAG: YDG domain-containing protein, partial [Candidatus Symbiothrix sp.]|nr:YDG domain-containing protein [Candidatus Symbiothrix sp.]